MPCEISKKKSGLGVVAKLVGPLFGDICYHLVSHTSLTIYIQRNITDIVNFHNLDISGKSFIGAQMLTL